MDVSMMIELFGYIGSALVVISMLMSSVIKLRVINTIGSCISATYALIIHSYPLVLMNVCLIIINIYNLTKLLKSNQSYDLTSVKHDDSFLEYFLNYYKDDIQNFFPEAAAKVSLADTAYIVCCDANPAGLLLGRMTKEDTLEIFIDYATPTYRDCSVGSFLYLRLAELGLGKMVYAGESENHRPYLQKMGFVNENGTYVKHLS